MTRGPVNRALLESFFQNPGDIYSDIQTESCFDVVADQIDENSAVFNADGSTLIPSPAIAGVTGTTVYDQLAYMETQIQANTGGVIAPGTVTTAMLQNGAVTHVKLEQSEQTASVGGILYAYTKLFGF